jgi:hypothetical protein
MRVTLYNFTQPLNLIFARQIDDCIDSMADIPALVSGGFGGGGGGGGGVTVLTLLS